MKTPHHSCRTKVNNVQLWSDGWFRRRTCVELNSGNNFRWENMRSEFKNSVQIKAVTNISMFKQYITNIVRKFNRKVPSLYLDRFSPGKFDQSRGMSLAQLVSRRKNKKWICAKETHSNRLVSRKSKAGRELRNVTEFSLCFFFFYRRLRASFMTSHATQFWANHECCYMKNTLQ